MEMGYLYRVVDTKITDDHDYTAGDLIIADENDIRIIKTNEDEPDILLIHVENIFGRLVKHKIIPNKNCQNNKYSPIFNP